MAIRGSDGSITLTTQVDQTGLKKGLVSMKKMGATVANIFVAIGVAAAAATVSITKQAVNAFADYQQMIGGIETLFGQSAKKLLAYAEDAFYTASMSANEYMKQVTLFSAALIRSVAGDTEKAADIANMAMIDIADNSAKLGTNIESIQLAYQGFARQQYILLDNLRIGYGGTRSEMERLLKDAQKITGIKYDIDNLADVYSAIHVIQEELGIAGTAAEEAEKTITGSAKMMKAAWQNTLAAIAGGGDLDKALNNLVYSVGKYIENIVPVVERALMGIGQLIEKVVPMLVQRITVAVTKAIPNLINAVFQMVIGSVKGLYEGFKAIFSGKQAGAAVEPMLSGIQSSIGGATDGMESLGDETEKAGKKAKKALAGFDELNILKDNSASGGAGAGANIGDVGGVAAPIESVMPTFEETEPPQYMVSILEKINELLTPTKTLIDQCVKATKEWAQGVDFSPLLTSLGRLWDELVKLNEEGHLDLGFLYTEVLLPLSKWAAETALPVVLDMISEAMRSMSTAMKPVREGLGLLLEKLSPVISFIGTVVLGVLGFFRDIFKEVANVFEEKGSKIIEIFAGIGDIVAVIWTIVGPILEEVWRVVERVFTLIAQIVGHVIGLVIDVLHGVIEFIAGVFTGDWERAWGGISGIFVGIWDFIVNILSGFWEFLKGVFEPIVQWINEKIVQPIADFFTNLWTNIKETFSNVGTWFSEKFSAAWEGIKNAFSSVGEFFAGIWTTIKEKFEGIGQKIGDAVSGAFKTAVNWVLEKAIGLINGFINGINSAIGLINKIPGVNISTINKLDVPKLATGAVLPPNKPFLAMVGDQKHGTNIEAPAELIKQMAKEAIFEAGASGQTTKEEHYYLNETELMSIVYKLVKGGERIRGNSLISGGAY